MFPGILIRQQAKQGTNNLPFLRSSFASVIFLLLLSIIIGSLMLFKTPKVYYYIPTIIIIHYAFALLTASVERSVFAGLQTPFNMLTLLYSGFAFIILANSLLTAPAFLASSRNIDKGQFSIDQKLLERDDYYCTFRILTRRCSTAFGLDYNPQLAPNPLYKNILYYNIWSHTFENYGPSYELKINEKESTSKKILIRNDQMTWPVSPDTIFPSNMKRYLVESGRKYSLWQLKENY
jgi:hypothetical protein